MYIFMKALGPFLQEIKLIDWSIYILTIQPDRFVWSKLLIKLIYTIKNQFLLKLIQFNAYWKIPFRLSYSRFILLYSVKMTKWITVGNTHVMTEKTDQSIMTVQRVETP